MKEAAAKAKEERAKEASDLKAKTEKKEAEPEVVKVYFNEMKSDSIEGGMFYHLKGFWG